MRALAALALLPLWVAGCGGGGSGPRIDQLAPPAAAIGARLDILGVGFCGAALPADGGASCSPPPTGFVTFGTREGLDPSRAQVMAWGDERITVTVPSGLNAGVMNVVVTVDGRQSNAADFEVTR